MKKFIAHLVWDDQGQDLIEYVLIGSVVSIGALLGARAIPAEYREPLHNTYWNESLADLPDAYEIDVLAEDTALVGLKVVLSHGGRVTTRAGNLVLKIPIQPPLPPATLEQIQWQGDRPVVD